MMPAEYANQLRRIITEQVGKNTASDDLITQLACSLCAQEDTVALEELDSIIGKFKSRYSCSPEFMAGMLFGLVSSYIYATTFGPFFSSSKGNSTTH